MFRRKDKSILGTEIYLIKKKIGKNLKDINYSEYIKIKQKIKECYIEYKKYLFEGEKEEQKEKENVLINRQNYLFQEMCRVYHKGKIVYKYEHDLVKAELAIIDFILKEKYQKENSKNEDLEKVKPKQIEQEIEQVEEIEQKQIEFVEEN